MSVFLLPIESFDNKIQTMIQPLAVQNPSQIQLKLQRTLLIFGNSTQLHPRWFQKLQTMHQQFVTTESNLLRHQRITSEADSDSIPEIKEI